MKKVNRVLLPVTGVLFSSIGLALGYLFNLVPKPAVFPAVVTLTGIVLMTFGAIYCILVEFINKQDLVVSQLTSRMQRHEASERLCSHDELASIETKAHSVSVLTRDFWEENNSDILQPIIEHNINRGVVYRYVYPEDVGHIAEAFEAKVRNFKPNANIQLRPVKRETFRFIRHEIVLYDCEDVDSKYHSGYLVDVFNSRSANGVPYINVRMDSHDTFPYFSRMFKELFGSDRSGVGPK